MFQGSRHVKSGDHFALLQGHGASLNATTSFDRTNYFESMPAGALDLALWLEADRMAYLDDVLTQENFRNQVDVVAQERSQRMDNVPYGTVFEKILPLVFDADHPYGHLPIGNMQHLAEATLDEVSAFHARYYMPSNAVLVDRRRRRPKTTRSPRPTSYFGHIEAGRRAEARDPADAAAGRRATAARPRRGRAGAGGLVRRPAAGRRPDGPRPRRRRAGDQHPRRGRDQPAAPPAGAQGPDRAVGGLRRQHLDRRQLARRSARCGPCPARSSTTSWPRSPTCCSTFAERRPDRARAGDRPGSGRARLARRDGHRGRTSRRHLRLRAAVRRSRGGQRSAAAAALDHRRRGPGGRRSSGCCRACNAQARVVPADGRRPAHERSSHAPPVVDRHAAGRFPRARAAHLSNGIGCWPTTAPAST